MEVKTAREWLETIGGADRVHCKASHLLDYETTAPVLWSSEGSGLLQVTCGGDVLFGMKVVAKDTTGRYYKTRMSLAVYLDNNGGREWDRKYLKPGAPFARPPRPFNRLTLGLIG